MFVRITTPTRTHCPKGHKYTPGSYRIRSDGHGKTYRQCIKCARATDSLRRKRLRDTSFNPEWLGTSCSKGHPRTPETTYMRPDGTRICRPCHTAESNYYRKQKREQAQRA